jgi:predicted nucleic acid-binding protein
MSTSQVAVIDANLAVLSTLNTPVTVQARRVMEHLLDRRVSLFAPRLWWYEVTSVVHKYLYDKLLTPALADQTLSILLGLAIQLVDEDDRLCRAAFHWATRLEQRGAYDGFYLAAAEQLNAEFWTADRKLANSANRIGVNWVRWMGGLSS